MIVFFVITSVRNAFESTPGSRDVTAVAEHLEDDVIEEEHGHPIPIVEKEAEPAEIRHLVSSHRLASRWQVDE